MDESAAVLSMPNQEGEGVFRIQLSYHWNEGQVHNYAFWQKYSDCKTGFIELQTSQQINPLISSI